MIGSHLQWPSVSRKRLTTWVLVLAVGMTARITIAAPRAAMAELRAISCCIAHCPTSNLRLGAGVAPVRAMTDAGVRVGLGVDGSASNERSHLFNDVRQALQPGASGSVVRQGALSDEFGNNDPRGHATFVAHDDRPVCLGLVRGRRWSSSPTGGFDSR